MKKFETRAENTILEVAGEKHYVIEKKEKIAMCVHWQKRWQKNNESV